MTEVGTGTEADETQPAGSRDADVVGRRRPNRWKVAFVTLLVLGVLGAVTWVLLGSRLLVVRHVEVTGTRLAPQDRVVAAAGIHLGLPMVRLNTGSVQAHVERLREVESAKVEREWPATVRIVVHERVPLAAVQGGGRYYQLDRHGVTVVDGTVRPRGLPALTVASPGPSDPSTLAALTVLAGLPGRIERQLQEVGASGPEEVTLQLTNGRTLVWGAAERAGEKIRLFDALQRTTAGRTARIIDVSSPEVVTTQ